MCGIAGFFSAGAPGCKAEAKIIGAMTDVLQHRGPDDGGTWCDRDAGIALGNRRLAIIDLSPAGHQPMHSACGRYVIAYNGEVYNADELRAVLQKSGTSFRGHSDTEVVLEACAAWGLEKTLNKLIGMFAFALWDGRNRRLFVVRDRLGIKPLYWTFTQGILIFGSELKALSAHPQFRHDIDRNAVATFLRYAYVPAPHTIYRNVHKLEPGKFIVIEREGRPRLERFWSLDDAVRKGRLNPFGGDVEEVCRELDRLILDAVQKRLVSDVPLGAFLSGGIDSTTVVSAMQAQSARAVKTYSIGFKEGGYDEAKDAAQVAQHLGTDHTELYATPDDARDLIPRLPEIYDEPFADSSQIPTFLISQLTRQHVTVALSGDGGDELFGGYTRYVTAQKYDWPLFKSPQYLRNGASCLLKSVSPLYWDRLGLVLPSHIRPPQFGERLHKLAATLGGSREDYYRALVSQWDDPGALVPGAVEHATGVEALGHDDRFPDFVSQMQYIDMRTYLPEDILTKVDRASMAVALEVRVPLLDHRIAEFSWRLPLDMKIRNGQGKWILRRNLERYVPKALIKRKKQGFAVPVGEWLRGPLRDWAEDLLSCDSLKSHSLLDAGPVRQVWQDHLSGRVSQPLKLWSVLMLQAWCGKYSS